MPWQGMETAPFDTKILALGFFETLPCITYLYSENDKDKYEKWLPLPGA